MNGLINVDAGIIWTFINILVLFLFMKKFLFKPVNDILEKRESIINSSLEDAESKKVEALQMKKEYETNLSQAGEQAKDIIKEARERAELEYNKKILEAKEDAAQVMVEANKQIELEKKKSMESAQAEIAGIAILAASKILSKNVDDSSNKQLVGDFLKEVGASK